MKFSDHILRIGLTIVVLTGLYLSFKIWTNPANNDVADSDQSQITATEVKAASEVFLPTKLIWHQTGNLQLSNRESLITTIQKKMSKWKYRNFKKISRGNQEEFNKIFQQNDTVELIYPNQMLLEEYNSVFKMNIKNIPKDIFFDRMIIPVDGTKIYFLTDENFVVYEVSIKTPVAELQKSLSDKNISYTPVSILHEELPYVYFLETDLALKQYSYILASQPYTTFTQAFFEDSSSLHPNEDGSNDLSYTDDKGSTLFVQTSSGSVSFQGDLKQTGLSDVNSNPFGISYYYVGKLGNSFGNIRFFDYQKNTLTYQNYVEGFPVFSDMGKGSIQVTIADEKGITIQTNVDTIQVPIPSDEEVSLAKTQNVVDQLTQTGVDFSSISDIQIGYTWENLTDTKQIVDLTPQWYIRYEDKWVTLSDLLATYSIGGKSE